MDLRDEQRFWSKVRVADSGCWLYLGATFDARGYGAFAVDGATRRAHRVAWEMIYGSIPPGLVVCHRCDVPTCVCPQHLFLGTQIENVADREAKRRTARGAGHGRTTKPERTARGERHGRAVLTNAQVASIRARYAAGDVITKLAPEYGVSFSTIWCVVSKATWLEAKE